MKYQMDTYIFEGLPVIVEFTMARAEPDVGIMSDYVDEWWFTHANGKKLNDIQAGVLAAILSESQTDDLETQCAEYARDYDQE